MKKILAINFGSTSTKMALFENETMIDKTSISHPTEEILAFQTAKEQEEYRKKTVFSYLESKNESIDELDAIVARGPVVHSSPHGIYRINELMVEEALDERYGAHATNLACILAYDLAKDRKLLPLTFDMPRCDEMEPVAKISGLKEIERECSVQVLNMREMGRYYASSIGNTIDELNLILVMLGGGITIVPSQKGRFIDAPEGVLGDGPFSTNRSCGLPIGPLIDLCYSGRYSKEEMLKKVNGEGGMRSYLGTADALEVENRMLEGDAYAELILDAMTYQVSKEIGACATVLKGNVDAILITGGMANSDWMVSKIKERVEFIAPVRVFPGEREMEALGAAAYRALTEKEEIREFV